VIWIEIGCGTSHTRGPQAASLISLTVINGKELRQGNSISWFRGGFTWLQDYSKDSHISGSKKVDVASVLLLAVIVIQIIGL